MRPILRPLGLAVLGFLALAPTAQAAMHSYTNGPYRAYAGGGGFQFTTTGTHPGGDGLVSVGSYESTLVHSYTSGLDYDLGNLMESHETLANGHAFGSGDEVSVAETLAFRTSTTITGGVSAADSLMRYDVTVANTGATTVSYGVRIGAPIPVGDETDPSMTPQGGVATTVETRYANPAFPVFKTENETLRALWSVSGSPDTFDWGRCCAFAMTPLLPEPTATALDVGAEHEGRWTWGATETSAMTLAPGASKTFTVAAMAMPIDSTTHTSDPAVGGTAQVDSTLTADAGAWSPWSLTIPTYRWQRCAADACTTIAGASGATYVPVAADVGSTLKVQVFANGDSSLSAATAVVTSKPVPPAPTPTPTPPSEPKFTATVGDGNAKSATVTAANDGVDVGCTMTGVALASCTVKLYADPKGATASSQVLIGAGTAKASKTTGKLIVRVKLNARGRDLLRRSPKGLAIAVKITGTPVSGTPLKTTAKAKLVPEHFTVTPRFRFAVDSAALTAAAERELRSLAKLAKGAASVKCTGHTERASDAGYLKRLGLRRAEAVCSFLGSKHTSVSSPGATKPVASNATAPGRALNRRVVVEITR